MKIYKGKVKYTAGLPREGQYGLSINVLVTLEDGTAQRIYGRPGDAIERLKSGQDVQMVEEKGKFKLIEAEFTPEATAAVLPPCNVNTTIELSDEEKYVNLTTKATMYAHIYRTIFQNLTTDGLIDKEFATPAASTIFIQLMNKEK